MNPSDFLGRLGRTVAFYPGLVKHLGSVNATVFFCQLFYWSAKCSSEYGVYKTATEFSEETGLTVDEQRTARAHLRKCGVLVETEKRLEHRIYYRLDLVRFDELVGEDSQPQLADGPAGETDISHPRNGNIPFGNEELPTPEVGNVQSDKEHKITSEITAESTAQDRTPSAGVGAEAAVIPEATQTSKRAGKSKPATIDVAGLELPEYLDREDFAEYASMRAEVKKKPFTRFSLRDVLADLEKLRSEGHDANKLLRKSTGKEWLRFVPNDDTLAEVANSGRFSPASPEEWWNEHVN